MQLLTRLSSHIRDKLITQTQFDVRQVITHNYAILHKKALKLILERKKIKEYRSVVDLDRIKLIQEYVSSMMNKIIEKSPYVAFSISQEILKNKEKREQAALLKVLKKGLSSKTKGDEIEKLERIMNKLNLERKRDEMINLLKMMKRLTLTLAKLEERNDDKERNEGGGTRGGWSENRDRGEWNGQGGRDIQGNALKVEKSFQSIENF